MSYHVTSSTALSAPGKVLLTGGYLVLDRNYTGTVFALDARIHVVVQQLRRLRRASATSLSGTASANRTSGEQPRGSMLEDKDNEDTIVVRSPQFTNALWEYRIERCQNGGGVRVCQKGDG